MTTPMLRTHADAAPLFEALESRLMLSINQMAAMTGIDGEAGGEVAVDLGDFFEDDAVSGTLVRIDTTQGSIYLNMFDSITPLTVANFLNYVEDGDFVDMFFHRLVNGFVLQGGGYSWAEGDGGPSAVPTDAAVDNEFDNWFTTGGGPLAPGTPLNVRGTLAMAKVGGDPDSATSGFFFNLADNSTNLDNQNGGFTVFADVPYGMDVVDLIASAQIVNAGAPFNELPVFDYQPSTVFRENLVLTEAVTVVDAVTYDVKVSNSKLLSAEVGADGVLTLTATPGVSGTATVTVTATDVMGNAVVDTFEVAIPPVVLTLTALDNDADEDGGTAAFTVSRTGATDADLLVKLKMKKAKFGQDFTVDVSDGGSFDGKVLTIPMGESEVTVTVTPIDDQQVEGDEPIIVQLKKAKGTVLSDDPAEQGTTITIADNEPTVTVEATDAEATEGADTATVRLSRTGGTADPLEVKLKLKGSAKPGKEVNVTIGGLPLEGKVVTIPAGQSFVDLVITPIDDTNIESVETLDVTVKKGKTYLVPVDPADALATVSVNDNDAAPIAPAVSEAELIGAMYAMNESATEDDVVDAIGLAPTIAV